MHRSGLLLLLLAGFLWSSGALATPVVVDFEGYPAFLSPGSSIPGITVSPEGGIIDEAGVTAVTGLTFPAGTVATSGTNLLGNLFGATLTITFETPAREVSVRTVGSLADAAFGTITMEAFSAAASVGSDTSDPAAIGDSGAPEDLLFIAEPAGFRSVVLGSDIGDASSFLVDDLSFTSIPEPNTWCLLAGGLIVGALASRRPC